MKRTCLPAITVAMVFCMVTAGANAATLLPNGSDLGVIAKFSARVSGIVDELEAGLSARSPGYPSVEAFAGPYRLMVAKTDQEDLSAMLLASLGLMAVIAYRRRSI